MNFNQRHNIETDFFIITMHQSPLIIDFYFVKKIHFELKDGFDCNSEVFENKEVESPKLTINVVSGKQTEHNNQWKFELNIDTDEKSSADDFPYIFSLSLVGFFRVDDNYPAENADLLAQVNAPSVLYSAAREFLANVTGRSPYPSILLPSVSFLPKPKEEKPKRKATSKNTKSKN